MALRPFPLCVCTGSAERLDACGPIARKGDGVAATGGGWLVRTRDVDVDSFQKVRQ